jgi:hypothetical protein
MEGYVTRWWVDTAYQIATAIHKGQSDLAGAPYIEHVLRVKDAVYGNDVLLALLHDTVEDGGEAAIVMLRDAGIPLPVRWGVIAISRQEGEGYEAYIDRLLELDNPSVLRVKRADLLDNLDVSRFRGQELTESHLIRLNKYLAALVRIEEALTR